MLMYSLNIVPTPTPRQKWWLFFFFFLLVSFFTGKCGPVWLRTFLKGGGGGLSAQNVSAPQRNPKAPPPPVPPYWKNPSYATGFWCSVVLFESYILSILIQNGIKSSGSTLFFLGGGGAHVAPSLNPPLGRKRKVSTLKIPPLKKKPAYATIPGVPKKRNGGFSVPCELKMSYVLTSLDRASSAQKRMIPRSLNLVE